MQTLTCKMSPFHSQSNIYLKVHVDLYQPILYMAYCMLYIVTPTPEVRMLETLMTESDLGNMLLLHWVCASDQSVHIRQLLGHYTNHLLPLVSLSIQKRGQKTMQAE